ncbi:MAG: ComEA family DNA-binding protein [Chloroflexota bacterium]
MTASGPNRYGTALIILLVAIIVTGSLVIWARLGRHQPVEIRPTETAAPPPPAGIYLGGAVRSPGFYPLTPADSLAGLLQAAGGTTDNADLGHLRLYLPAAGEADTPQKVDLNRAEPWLLEALPGIGPERARAIVDYRQRHGPFRSTEELTQVPGIGPDTYQDIKSLITVAD